MTRRLLPWCRSSREIIYTSNLRSIQVSGMSLRQRCNLRFIDIPFRGFSKHYSPRIQDCMISRAQYCRLFEHMMSLHPLFWNKSLQVQRRLTLIKQMQLSIDGLIDARLRTDDSRSSTLSIEAVFDARHEIQDYCCFSIRKGAGCRVSV